MNDYIELIDNLVFEKTGKKVCEIDYMELPEEDERYNIKLSIGNVNLFAGRIKTKRKADKLVNKFLNKNIK